MKNLLVGTLALATAIGVPALRAWRGEAPFPTPEAALVLALGGAVLVWAGRR
ncbi:MAG: hypothetical protein ABWJ90_09350 [Thermus sp.]|uniref:hypothetical protein n=1 Tax=Thermus sp. TaxID=275 RepID=UPI00351B1201